jgi:Skp family chaperone for outer membrane proteins
MIAGSSGPVVLRSIVTVGESFFAIERKQVMNHSRVAILGMVASLFAATAFTSNVQAQAAAPTHIAVVNLQKVYSTMAETGEWQRKLTGLQGQLKTLQDSHQGQLKEAQDKLNNNLKPGTQAYQDAVTDLDAKSLQFSLDEQTFKVKMAREANRTLRQEFDEIQATVKDIATKQGLDLVLVASNPDIPANYGDAVDFEHLAQALFSRNLLYASEKSDITEQVIAQLDAAHKAPPAPAH